MITSQNIFSAITEHAVCTILVYCNIPIPFKSSLKFQLRNKDIRRQCVFYRVSYGFIEFPKQKICLNIKGEEGRYKYRS